MTIGDFMTDGPQPSGRRDTGQRRGFAAPPPPAPEPTGRHLVVFRNGVDAARAKQTLGTSAGTRTMDVRELSIQEAMTVVRGDDALVFPRFNLAVVSGDDAGRMSALSGSEAVLQVRPEFFLFPIVSVQARFEAWLRDGLELLLEREGTSLLEQPWVTQSADSEEWTWGLQALGVPQTPFTGRGIRVAVLDTGLDLEHPDFKGRAVVAKSFVPGEDVDDAQGHGSHCAGTAAGPMSPQTGPRYGVAPDVQLYVAKVLSNRGAGREADIILGMNWALNEKCTVISMSLGRPATLGEAPDETYENVGAAALAEGSLIVAAAGNESARKFGYVAPVGVPANSPSIMAVAAVDSSFRVADFSCGGLNGNGGEVNIAGPGTAVYSAAPLPRRYRTLQGTSMACPHVAGAAALWAESDGELRGSKLWSALTRSARTLNAPARDVGVGLVQVPGAPAIS